MANNLRNNILEKDVGMTDDRNRDIDTGLLTLKALEDWNDGKYIFIGEECPINIPEYRIKYTGPTPLSIYTYILSLDNTKKG